MEIATRKYPNFHAIAKPFGPICNLDCTYCFYLEKEKLYPTQNNWSMPDNVLERFISQYIAAQQRDTVSFTWQGGEPTLAGLPFFEKVVALQQKYANGKSIENALQTNAVLIDAPWAEFLARHDFLVGVSLDGPPELHNAYRTFKGGRGSFDAVLHGLRMLQQHNVPFNTLTVVNRQTGNHPLEIYNFLKQVGSHYMQFLPVVERQTVTSSTHELQLVAPDAKTAAIVTPWSVEPLQYGNFLCTIFNEWVQHDVARYFIQVFDVALENWLGLTPALCVFRETCGSAIAVEHNGDVFSCDHYVYPEHKLGNLMGQELLPLIESPQQHAFGNAKHSTLPQYCQQCEVQFACHGECPKHRFTQTPSGEWGLNYLCAGYKKFFNHITPYMEFMAKELRAQRPPANVMQWVKQHQPTPL
jgi:uncharacterized protein